jgi:hypothetical protein
VIAPFIYMFGVRAIALLFTESIDEIPESPREPVEQVE